MFFYLIAILLFAIALILFILAPRNLWDSWIATAGVIALLIAMVRFPFFSKYPVVQTIFRVLSLFVKYVAPSFLIILGTSMFFQAYYLYLDEKNKTQYVISTILSILLVVISVLHYVALFSTYETVVERREWMNIPNFLIAYYVILFLNFILNTVRLSLAGDEGEKDYVLILGARFNEDGSMSDTLQRRLIEATQYLKRQQYLYSKMPKVIVSGAKTVEGSRESEAQMMADYLVKQGIPRDHIILETKAKNTHQNFIYAKEIIEQENPHLQTVRVAYVTSTFHLYRSQLYANMEDLYSWVGIGSSVSFREWVMHGLREFVAVIFMHRKFHFLMSLVMLAIGWVNYRNF